MSTCRVKVSTGAVLLSALMLSSCGERNCWWPGAARSPPVEPSTCPVAS